jgi:broad specificity phosphatase PhoE
MPQGDNPYLQKVYQGMQQAYGDNGAYAKGNFNLPYDQFAQKMSDSSYAQKVYNGMDQAYGENGKYIKGNFTIGFDDFYQKAASKQATNQVNPANFQPATGQSLQYQPEPQQPQIPGAPIPSPNIGRSAPEAHAAIVDQEQKNTAANIDKYSKSAATKMASDFVQKQVEAAIKGANLNPIDISSNSEKFQKLKEQIKNIHDQALDPETGYAAAAKINLANDATGNTTGQFIKQIANDHPEIANQVNRSAYLASSGNRSYNASKILSNAEKIGTGDLGYDASTGQVTRPQTNFFEAMGTAFAKRNKDLDDYDFLANSNDNDIINKLETDYHRHDPDEPIPVPKGFGGVPGAFVGGQGILTAEGLTTGIVGGIGGSLFGSPELGPVAATAVTTPEIMQRAYAQSVTNNYRQLRDEGKDPQEALEIAQNRGTRESALQGAQGALMTYAGAKFGAEGAPSFENPLIKGGLQLTPAAKNSVVQSLGKIGKEAGMQGLIGSGTQVLTNLSNNRPIFEDVPEAGEGAAAFTGILGTLLKSPEMFSKKSANNIKALIATAPQDEINKSLATLVKDGILLPNEAEAHAKDFLDLKETLGKLPTDIPSQNVPKVLDLLKQRNDIKAALENADDAYRPQMEEHLSGLNEQIKSLSSKPSSDDLVGKAQAEIAKGEIKGYSKSIFENATPEQLPQLLREVAEQSYDPNRSKGAENIFGKGLIDIAQEMHPIESMPEYTARINHIEPGDENESNTHEPISNTIQPDKSLRTIDYGDYADGKTPETPIAKDQIAKDISSWDKPIGETGETFRDFLGRVIPAFKKSLDEDPNNTTVVTHSSVLKAYKVWDDMGRPDIDNLTPEQEKEFADKYNDQSIEPGAVESFNKKASSSDIAKMSDVIGKPVMYKGQKATIEQDGQTIIAKIDGTNREYELGNVDKLSDQPVTSFNIQTQEPTAKIDNDGNIIVRGQKYVNTFDDPIQAINRDKDGNIVSVNLETPDGQKRTFKGDAADDLAYQLTLQHITANNETKSLFEEFLNDPENSDAVQNGGLSKAAQEQSTSPDEQIHVVRHGETDDNAAGFFRSNDAQLTENGINEAKAAGEELLNKLNGRQIPKIISSDLPRTIHTSNLIHEVVSGEKAPPSAIEINDNEHPNWAADAVQGSYDRLIEGGADPNDPDMVRMKQTIEELKNKAHAINDEDGAKLFIEDNEPKLLKQNPNAIPEQTTNEMGVRNEEALRPGVGGQNEGPQEFTENSSNEKKEGSGEKIDPQLTSLMNKVTGVKRAQFGLPEAEKTARKEFGEIWQEAQDAIDNNKMSATTIISSTLKKPRPWSDVENAVVLKHQIGLESQLGQTQEGLIKAQEAKDQNSIDDLHVRQQALLAQLQDVYDAGKKAGTENARGLATRQIIARNQYSLENMVNRMRAAKGDGAKLTIEEMNDVKNSFNEINDQEDKLQKMATAGFTSQKSNQAGAIRTALTNLRKAQNNFNQKVSQIAAPVNKAWAEKAGDIFLNYEREAKLSGITTLAKLGAAGVTRLVQTPVEDAIGGLLSKIPGISKIAKQATSEGNLHIAAEAKIFTDGIIKGIKDIGDVWDKKTGHQTEIDVLGGKSPMPDEGINFFGRIHKTIKTPIRRAIFEKSFMNQTFNNMKNGVNVKDPVLIEKMAIQAVKDADRAIFMSDNLVTDAYKATIRSLEKSDKPGGKAVATGLKWFIPFVKVPTNIIGETGTLAGGGLLRAGWDITSQLMKKSFDNMEPEMANRIMRNLKKGSFGAALLTIGALNPEHFGGFYQKGEKKEDGEPNWGEANVMGVNVPRWLLESPVFQTMQLGATARKLMDKSVDTDDDPHMTNAIIASMMGLAEEAPLFPSNIGNLSTEKGRGQYFNDLAKNTVDPVLLQQISQWQSGGTKYAPENMGQPIESGLPWLNKNVPEKEER